MGFKEFFNIFLEERKFKRQSPLEILRKYKDDKNVFISFTEIEKLGLNPRSKYETPLGIYCYPVKDMWKHISSFNIPFAGNRPYLWIFKGKRPSSIAYGSSYTQDDLKKDILILEKNIHFWKDVYNDFKSYSMGMSSLNIPTFQEFVCDTLEEMIGILDELEDNSPKSVEYRKNLLELAKNNFPKWEENEMKENPILYKEWVKDYEKLLKKKGYVSTSHIIDKIKNSPNDIDNMLEVLLSRIPDEYKKTPIQCLWSITRELAKNNPLKWSKILSILYSGIVDDRGDGFIHINEPIQAVFFNIGGIEIVDLIKRKSDEWFPKHLTEISKHLYLMVLKKIPISKGTLENFFEKMNNDDWESYFYWLIHKQGLSYKVAMEPIIEYYRDNPIGDNSISILKNIAKITLEKPYVYPTILFRKSGVLSGDTTHHIENFLLELVDVMLDPELDVDKNKQLMAVYDINDMLIESSNNTKFFKKLNKKILEYMKHR